ncbi:methanogenic corrinoid protein MtbC1 [Paraburkholderia sp. JPY465]|uniref:hypothetical protein n=1 Tax=Paraburkholderia sp. JPY465 TaxID=3042285 RepID=UPI003D24314B
MKKGSAVMIEVNGSGVGRAVVDGVEIPAVQAASATVEAGQPPIVTLRIAVKDAMQLRYEGAQLYVDGVAMPASIERELWRYLAPKYGREIDVTTLQSSSRISGLADD